MNEPTKEQIESFRTKHRKAFDDGCWRCDVPWPCPTILLLSAYEERGREVERLRAELAGWRHAAEKGAALCRAMMEDGMDDYECDEAARNLHDEVKLLAAAQPEEENQ